jgi:2-phospho-L-lactate transferase/gluconeogenesis factor (CofD/UPF0052 family)
MVRVVLFSGGRGSRTLSELLAIHPAVDLTVAINGYDDGASTGRVRGFLGDCLGPSDFRKNASRLARLRRTCPDAVIEFLDFRLPVGCLPHEGEAVVGICRGDIDTRDGETDPLVRLAARLPEAHREPLAIRLEAFLRELHTPGRRFDFSDCAIGNLVFAGGFLLKGRRFNDAVDDYVSLLGLPRGLVLNVTDGTNALLVAINGSGEVLATEEAIVDATRPNQVAEIFLLSAPLTPAEELTLKTLAVEARRSYLAQHAASVPINPDLDAVLSAADLIIYAPGTQHSSLFPSYLTQGLSRAIARNLTATKLLVTNIQPDAEIVGRSAVDLVDRAVFYLEEKGALQIPTPALITHYLINDPGRQDAPHVPMGRLDAIDDPRLVRIAYYEDGVSGRHDATKVLTPFLNAFLKRERRARVGLVLHDVDSANKLCQTLLEMIRGDLPALPADLLVVHGGSSALDAEFAAHLPFTVVHVPAETAGWDQAVTTRLDAWDADHVVLFESSGMYRGEDIRELVVPLLFGRSDAVWGSRRLSPRDIDESYRLRYRNNLVLGAASFFGSYALSVMYFLLFGRYIADTLSGARAMRYRIFRDAGVTLSTARTNHRLLGAILRARASIHEVPVRFLPLSPERVKRTTLRDGLVALLTIIGCRFERRLERQAWHGKDAR